MSGTVVLSAPRRWAPAGLPAQLLVAQVLTAVTALGVNVLAARGLVPDSRGALALFLQVVYALTAVTMLGRDRSYPATVSGRPPLATAARDIGLLLLRPLTVVGGGCLVVFPLSGGAVSVTQAVVGGVGFALALAGNVGLVAARSASIAAGSGHRYLAAVTAAQAGLLGVTAGLVVAGQGHAVLWLLAYGVALGVAAAGWFVACRGARPADDGGEGRVRARRLGLRLLPASLAGIVMLRADRLLLPGLGSLEQLGLYIVVAALTEALAWPVQSVVDARIPAWRRRAAAGTLRPGRLVLGVLAYAVAAAAAVALLLSVLLVPVFGEAYADARALVAPLSAASACYAVSRVGVGLGLARGTAVSVVGVDLLGMGVALAAYLVLIPPLGALGAAWGCLVGYGTAAAAATVLALLPAHRRAVRGGVPGKEPADGTP